MQGRPATGRPFSRRLDDEPCRVQHCTRRGIPDRRAEPAGLRLGELRPEARKGLQHARGVVDHHGRNDTRESGLHRRHPVQRLHDAQPC